tara:strand:- start:574 stop:846 length:273 start_codon:yes stop_codon:yes gene_type:complete
MRVICIENSIMIDKNRPDFGSIVAHKGSVYNVIGYISHEELKEKKGLVYAPGPWYEFLELQGYHHHIRFIELPEDDIEIETIKNKTYESK